MPGLQNPPLGSSFIPPAGYTSIAVSYDDDSYELSAEVALLRQASATAFDAPFV